VPKTTVFSLGWGEAHSEVAIGKVHEHAEIPTLDGFGDCLHVLHLEWTFGLKFVQRTIIGAEPKTSVLFGYRKDGRLEVPERFAPGSASDLRA
jgi:hypothetical protein